MKTKLNEYVLLYARLSDRKWFADTYTARTGADAEELFYETHSRKEYRVRNILKTHEEDYEPKKSHEEIMEAYRR